MRIRLTAVAPLLLLASSFAFAAAQVPAGLAPPPIKMGLWEATVTANTGMGPKGITSVHQSCMTPDSWKDLMQKIQARTANVTCTSSNLQQDSHKISFDGSCSMDQGMTANYHVEMFLDGDTAMHGTTTGKISGPMFPNGMTIGSSMTSKFISSDCGDVKPGESKTVKP
jgi:hypothetical protein